MNIKINDQKKDVTVWPEEFSSQQEMDTLQRQEEVKLADKNKKIDKNLVAGLVKKSNRILGTISTHKFPFDFFPDTINVEEGRITVVTRDFFFSSQVHSVDIKDISNIFINMAPFFAQLIIVSKTFKENEIRIKYLRKKEAVFARRMIEGLRIFENKQIDTSVYTKEELIAKLEELSTTEIVT
ncbi:MAG: hypothetical protein NT052_02405 [Candidatus Shapirobacteria bacterium]|nr:hypothetical protein [Candidatus Shapirobacteria bacterium]